MPVTFKAPGLDGLFQRKKSFRGMPEPHKIQGSHAPSLLARGLQEMLWEPLRAGYRYFTGEHEGLADALADAVPDDPNAALLGGLPIGGIFLKGREPLLEAVVKPAIQATGGKRAANRFAKKFSKDVPSENTALDALSEMLEASGIPKDDLATYGMEWEGRNRLHIPEMRKKLRGTGYTTGAETSMSYRPNYGEFRYPQEIVGDPLAGWDDIERFANELGPLMDEYHRGGPWGGGGHLNVSWPEMQTENIRPFMMEWLRAEPWLYPSKSAHRPKARAHVMPLLENLGSERPRGHSAIWTEPKPNLREFGRAGPGKAAAFNARPLDIITPSLRRTELRGFASPEQSEGWIENIALAQALLNQGRANPRSAPETLDELMNEIYEEIINPNAAQLRLFHEKQMQPQGVEAWMQALDYKEPLGERLETVRGVDPWLRKGGLLDKAPFTPEAELAERSRRVQARGNRPSGEEVISNILAPGNERLLEFVQEHGDAIAWRGSTVLNILSQDFGLAPEEIMALSRYYQRYGATSRPTLPPAPEPVPGRAGQANEAGEEFVGEIDLPDHLFDDPPGELGDEVVRDLLARAEPNRFRDLPREDRRNVIREWLADLSKRDRRQLENAATQDRTTGAGSMDPMIQWLRQHYPEKYRRGAVGDIWEILNDYPFPASRKIPAPRHR